MCVISCIPRLIRRLCDHRIAQVMCGNQHCIALSKGAKDVVSLDPLSFVYPSFTCAVWQNPVVLFCLDGQLFTWGQNTSGQLGLGKGEPSKLFPQPLKSLAGIPLAKITAGGDHSFALSLSGAVFGWGKNKAGQLGLNDIQGRFLLSQ